MAEKKYMSLQRLQEYDALIKAEIDSAVESGVTNKADKATTLAGYKIGDAYTKTEVDSKIQGVNTSITNITNGDVVVKEAEHAEGADHATSADSATTAGSATSATKDSAGNTINTFYETKTDANSKLAEAKSYTDTEVAKKADSGHNHDAAYDAKGSASTAETNSKSYTDQQIALLLNNSSEAVDSIYELRDAMEDNADAIEALNGIASGKANATHSHAIADITNLQTTLNAKAAQSSLDSHTGNTTVHITSTERTNWNAAKTHADSAHAPSNAEKNQNAFSNVAVSGQTTVAADTATDTLTLVAGNNVTITTNATNDSITIAATDTKVTVDTALSSTSINPVQNKVVNSAVSTLTSAVGANTDSISAHSTAISNLQTAVSEIKEITSEDIQALFA